MIVIESNENKIQNCVNTIILQFGLHNFEVITNKRAKKIYEARIEKEPYKLRYFLLKKLKIHAIKFLILAVFFFHFIRDFFLSLSFVYSRIRMKYTKLFLIRHLVTIIKLQFNSVSLIIIINIFKYDNVTAMCDHNCRT